MSQQGFLNFCFVRILSTGILAPSHFAKTQQAQSTQSTIIEQIQLNNESFFIFAEHTPYNEQYTPRYYYIYSRIRDKKGVTIEVLPEEGFNEDDEPLAPDLAEFQDAQRTPTSASGGRVGSGSTQYKVINAEPRSMDTEEEGEE
ncbi:hypothetical protein P167DRAFT_579826 [Morchella conica CCBAS932]|uniref:Uncharacterized protein n=1 Tax=Morchella conica CCBAS932 TaxID=1392247 RepID=A0A3N4K8S5_9PEZI|nr:hypothetical protein P167DRAFT_579826 [Morchella conica CCBAS932]